MTEAEGMSTARWDRAGAAVAEGETIPTREAPKDGKKGGGSIAPPASTGARRRGLGCTRAIGARVASRSPGRSARVSAVADARVAIGRATFAASAAIASKRAREGTNPVAALRSGNGRAPAEGLLGAHGQDGGAEASHLWRWFEVFERSDRSRVCEYAARGAATGAQNIARFRLPPTRWWLTANPISQ